RVTRAVMVDDYALRARRSRDVALHEVPLTRGAARGAVIRALHLCSAVRSSWGDATTPGHRICDPLSALAEQRLDRCHLGVRCPEDPDPISHLSPPSGGAQTQSMPRDGGATRLLGTSQNLRKPRHPDTSRPGPDRRSNMLTGVPTPQIPRASRGRHGEWPCASVVYCHDNRRGPARTPGRARCSWS